MNYSRFCLQSNADRYIKKRNPSIEKILGPRPDAHKTLINDSMKYACGGCFGKASFTFAYSLPLLPLRKPKHASRAFQSRVGFCHPPTPFFFYFLNILRSSDPSWSLQVLHHGSFHGHSADAGQDLMTNKQHLHTESTVELAVSVQEENFSITSHSQGQIFGLLVPRLHHVASHLPFCCTYR